MEQEPLVIVGAGIAGLALAAGLRRRGRAFVILEERDRVEGGAGITLWPNALAALDRLGLGGRVRDAGAAVAAGAIRRPDGRELRQVDRARFERALGGLLISIHRATLIDVLRDAAGPENIRDGCSVDEVRPTADGATVRLTTGDELAAPAVVGADGIRSAVNRSLGNDHRLHYSGLTAWRAVAQVPIGDDEGGETWAPGAEFGCVPLGPENTYWFAAQVTEEGGTSPEGELAYLRRVFGDWHAPTAELMAATDPGVVTRHDLYDRATARCWSQGAVVVIGDAAHPMRPHLGQGGCQGLEDAAILDALIAGPLPFPDAFVRFAESRRRRTSGLVRQSAFASRLITARPPVVSAALHRASAAMPTAMFLRQLRAVAGSGAFQVPAVD